MGANPHTNGGLLTQPLDLPDFREYAVPVQRPGTGQVEATRVLGAFLRDVMTGNDETFRMMAPDEHNSNRLQDVLEVTDRAWNRSEEHTSELQSLMRNSYAVFCLKKKNTNNAMKFKHTK